MAKISSYIGYGLHADRPAAGAPGAVYFESDTAKGYRDNGASWDLITSAIAPYALAVQAMDSGPITIAAGNTLVVNTVTDQLATLPAAADAAGQVVVIKNMGHASFVDAASGDALESDVTGPYHVQGNYGAAWLVCDGTAWYVLSHMYAP